jgi:hypothetical protein
LTLTSELKGLEEIEASGWKPRIDLPPEFSGDRTDAALLPLHHRTSYSALEFLRLILGSWLDAELRPYIDTALEKCRKHAPKGQVKHYRALHDGELLKYILARCIEALQRHRKHKLDGNRLSSAAAQLMNSHRLHALSARFAVEPNELTDILDSWTPWICSFLMLGSVSAADEAMFAHWGKNADDKRHLQHIPGKPHDFGMVAYLIVQRLQHTDMPFALALSINHIQRSVTPTECVINLHTAVTAVDPNELKERHLVVDSLWSSAATLKRFDLHGIKYCVSVKSDSKIIPAPLFEVSSSDLPKCMACTYTNGTLTLEVVNSGKYKVRLLTNMCAEDGLVAADLPTIGAYATAVHLFDKETPQELVRMFQLGEEWATQASEAIIHHHLGWDVLRPLDQQGTNAPLTFAAVKDMKVSQIRRIRQLKLPRARQSIGTKEAMLHELFPNEQRQADANLAETQERGRKRRAREKLRELDLIRERVRIQFLFTFQIGPASLARRCVGRILMQHPFVTSMIPTTTPLIA